MHLKLWVPCIQCIPFSLHGILAKIAQADRMGAGWPGFQGRLLVRGLTLMRWWFRWGPSFVPNCSLYSQCGFWVLGMEHNEIWVTNGSCEIAGPFSSNNILLIQSATYAPHAFWHHLSVASIYICTGNKVDTFFQVASELLEPERICRTFLALVHPKIIGLDIRRFPKCLLSQIEFWKGWNDFLCSHCKHHGSREACALSSCLPQVASCPYSPLINRSGLNAWGWWVAYRGIDPRANIGIPKSDRGSVPSDWGSYQGWLSFRDHPHLEVPGGLSSRKHVFQDFWWRYFHANTI